MRGQRKVTGLDTVERTRKGIYILPNLFTTGGLFAAFYAIVQANVGNFENAAIAIFVAMVMDGLDGRVARMTHTASDFGKEYDSLVDVVAFGLAPALVMYEWTLRGLGKVGWLTAFIYVAATALRLARFNTQDVADKRYFQGMPCPAAAATLAAWVWTVDTYNLGGAAAPVSLAVIIALALAMVSNLPFRSFKDLDLKDRVPFVALLFLVFLFVLISFDPPRVLLAGFSVYLVSGPVVWLYLRRRGGTVNHSMEHADTEGDDNGEEARLSEKDR
jgi:CDP-diacylglycerol--serine O-phosphatidyltransferase